jgi:hypothetical protein
MPDINKNKLKYYLEFTVNILYRSLFVADKKIK